MKIEHETVESFQLGVKETSKARIAANAKAFEILSSTLYSNAILAIVRELCANAKDSHIAAGKADVPFDVQIPNTLDPRFVVRDYGVGMTHEFVMNNLNTYFESTKNDNNDELGGFGLGIKCPFSYASSFTISCYDGAIRRVYSFQIGADGLPEIILMAETPSTEAKGVEVSVPAKAVDYDSFIEATAQSVVFYDVRPNMRGMQDELLKIEKIYEGSDWAVYKHNQLLTESEYVEMGGVIYPVVHEAPRFDPNAAYPHQTMMVIQSGMQAMRRHHRHGYHSGSNMVMVFKAGIGEVSITPNREQLKITPETTMFLTKAKVRMQTEIKKNIQAKLDTCTGTFWEVLASEYHDIISTNVFLDRCEIDPTKFTYKGRKLGSNFCIKPPKEINHKTYEIYNYHGDKVQFNNTSRTTFEIALNNQFLPVTKFIVIPNGVLKTIPNSHFLDVVGVTEKNIRYYVIETDQISEIEELFKTSIPDGEELLIVPDMNKVNQSLTDLMIYKFMNFAEERNWYYNQDGKERMFKQEDFTPGDTVVYCLLGDNQISKLVKFVESNIYYDNDSFTKLLKAHNLGQVLVIGDNVKDRLEKIGVNLINMNELFDEFVLAFAKNYADRVPEMSLKMFVEPLQVKYKDISENTFIKAIKRWARECDRDDVRKMILEMEKDHNYFYQHRVEQPFKELTGIAIEEYLKSKKITRKLEINNQFVQDLAKHAPLAAMLVRNYSNSEVCEYVKKEMAALKKPKKKSAKSS